MSVFQATIPIGLGDIIYIKSQLDAAKDRFSEIRVNFHRELIANYRENNIDYNVFLDDIGKLFFSEKPYILGGSYPYHSQESICSSYQLPPKKPNLRHLLCSGTPLNLGCEYVVLTTKIRYLKRNSYKRRYDELWNAVKRLSTKYKIVVMGEREVEMNQEYRHYGSDSIYSIYNDIKQNIPADRLVDLTIPALGITSPKLSNLQQDCLVMSQAKLAITLGIGGNFGMSTAVANTIGYREDDNIIADKLYHNVIYPDAHITKTWNVFIDELSKY